MYGYEEKHIIIVDLSKFLHNLTQWSDRAQMRAKYNDTIISMASQTEH